MRVPGFSVLLLAPVLLGQPPVDHKRVIERLGAEADRFERSAHRVAGLETLVQTVPNGVRIGRNMRGGEILLPGYVREIISEYGFISMDVRGGSLREVRKVLTIDGLKWSKGSKSLKALARDMTAKGDKGRKQSLERFEEYGLTGFVSDLGQLILLFARGGAARYEIQFEKAEDDGKLAYTYQQLDGPEALTIYGETADPLRKKLHGRIWVQADTYVPWKISIESLREYDEVPVVDRSTVEYEMSGFGCLLPVRIVHTQHVGKRLQVTDDFAYSGFRKISNSASR